MRQICGFWPKQSKQIHMRKWVAKKKIKKEEEPKDMPKEGTEKNDIIKPENT